MNDNKYEVLVSAESEEWAVDEFKSVLGPDKNAERYDIHQYDEVTFGVFFTTEDPLVLENHPLVVSVDELEAAQ